VLGINRTVQAFDAFDGRRLWAYQKAGDPLTLAQPGVLAAFKDTLLVGHGSRLVALDPTLGTVRWEPLLATPRGTNEVERLADLVGPPGRAGDTVCARAFQSSVACVDAERGSLAWTRIASGTDGVATDGQLVLGADASDRITAWRVIDGSVAWTFERLLYRGLVTPVVAPAGDTKAFVFADGQGMVHWLSRESSTVLARLPTDGSAVHAAPAQSGTTTLVLTSEGGLFAFRAP
jgi:outer membrane protein assembly factor BamB